MPLSRITSLFQSATANVYSPSANTVAIRTSSADRLTLDSSGNLGLAVTPSAWASTYKVAQVGNGGAVYGRTNSAQVGLSSNYYSDGTDRYITTAAATAYVQSAGSHLWYNAPSGTAGNAITFTQAMTLDASGRLLVGTTSAQIAYGAYAFQVAGNDVNKSGMLLQRFSNDANDAQLSFLKTRGTAIGDTTIVQNGDSIGGIYFGAADGAAYRTAASVRAQVDGAPGASDMPGRLVFSTTADGASSPTERMRIDSSGNVGIGTSSPSTYGKFVAYSSGGYCAIDGNGFVNSYQLLDVTTAGGRINGGSNQGLLGSIGIEQAATGAKGGYIIFRTCPSGSNSDTERARITSDGDLLVGKTAASNTNKGATIAPSGEVQVTITTAGGGSQCLFLNRQDTDGTLVLFRQANTTEGDISVSGTTVSYNGGHLSRYAQTTTAKDESLVKGTVLSNLDAMNEYFDADGNPVPNEQLNKVKVSDVEGDVNVAGVFVNWTHDDAHNVDEINMAMTGDMIIRIAQGVTVQKGDLLMSAGDGTAKPQGDDIVRSKTVAKVTSNHVTCTYEDGSYCVPCVLMAC